MMQKVHFRLTSVAQKRCCLRSLENVDAKCWLAEMTLEMTSLPLARVFQCLFSFALVSASRWLTKIWQLSRRRATNSRDVVASSSSFSRPAARAPWRACSQASAGGVGNHFLWISMMAQTLTIIMNTRNQWRAKKKLIPPCYLRPIICLISRKFASAIFRALSAPVLRTLST